MPSAHVVVVKLTIDITTLYLCKHDLQGLAQDCTELKLIKSRVLLKKKQPKTPEQCLQEAKIRWLHVWKGILFSPFSPSANCLRTDFDFCSFFSQLIEIKC